MISKRERHGSIVALTALLLLGIVGATQLVPQPRVESGQSSVTPTVYKSETLDDIIMPISVGLRTDWSDFAVRGTVASITGPYFNTNDGLVPPGDYIMDYEEAPVDPFQNIDPNATEPPDYAVVYEATAQAWTAAGGLVSHWQLYRLAVVDIVEVRKGISTTDKLVLILPGGIYTHTTATDTVVYDQYHNIDALTIGNDVFIFSNFLWQWQRTYAASAYPEYQRCIALASELSQQGTEAYCQLLGAAYVIDGGQGSSFDYPQAMSVRAIETQIAQAVATVPVSSTLKYDDPDYKGMGGNWPIPTATP